MFLQFCNGMSHNTKTTIIMKLHFKLIFTMVSFPWKMEVYKCTSKFSDIVNKSWIYHYAQHSDGHLIVFFILFSVK